MPDQLPEIKEQIAALEVVACASEEDICEEEDEDYPTLRIEDAVKRHKDLKSKNIFNEVFGSTCELNDIKTRNGFDFREHALCDSYKKYIFPKKARSSDGHWRYIVNTEEYKQGVTIEVCDSFAEGEK